MQDNFKIPRHIAFIMDGNGRWAKEKGLARTAGHREGVDGSGYPRGLKGDEISIEARIICVVDSFHAIVSSRCYREGRSIDSAIHEIRNCAGTQFDPVVVDAFLRALKKELQKKGQAPSALAEYAAS